MKAINNRGSVTVYLILIFSVLSILIVAVIGFSRYQSEKTNALRSLDIAEESAFSKYFRPLLDNYGLFYYIAADEEALSADIMSYFVKNQEGISHMISITPSFLDVYETGYALDDNADNVKKQMKNTVKDTLAETAAGSIIKRLTGISKNNTDNNAKLDSFENEVNEVKEEAKKEEDVLRFLKLVEGITVSGGKVKCAKNYAKCGLTGEVNSTNAGIASETIWKAVKSNSWDISEFISGLIEKASKGLNGKNVSYPSVKAKNWRDKLVKIKEKTTEAKKLAYKIKGIKNAICDVDSIAAKLEANEGILNALIELGNIKAPTGTEDWNEVYIKANECLDMLNGYHVKDINFDYSTLNLNETDDPTENVNGDVDDILSFLIDDSNNLSENGVTESGIYEDIAEEIKKDNQTAMQGQTAGKEQNNSQKNNSDNLDFSEVDSIDNLLGKCRGKDNEKNSEKNNEKHNNGFEDGDIHGVNDEKTDEEIDGSAGADSYKIYDYVYIDRFFEEYDCKSSSDSKKDAGDNNNKNKIKKENNDNSSDNQRNINKKSGSKKLNHILNYEKEYLINADLTDRENLKSTVKKILFIRTGTSLVYLVSSLEARNLAYATAACLVGFTGLDALVRCVQYMIIAAWAYEDACVDTGALLAGHRIPVVKSKNSLNVRYEELVLFSKKLLQEKIKAYSDSAGMTYGDYVRMFLMTMSFDKLIYRCMDIIQFNMKQGFDNLFSFQRAIYGTKVRLFCEKPYNIVTESEYSYR